MSTTVLSTVINEKRIRQINARWWLSQNFIEEEFNSSGINVLLGRDQHRLGFVQINKFLVYEREENRLSLGTGAIFWQAFDQGKMKQGKWIGS